MLAICKHNYSEQTNGEIVNPETVTCTIRIPQRLKNRLDRSVETLGISLNQVIVDILESKYHAAGFIEDMKIRAGSRLLQISIQSVNHPPGMPERRFCLVEQQSESTLASYIIGFSSQFMWQLHIQQADQYSQLEEIGLALFHYYNGHGQDITRLDWDQIPTIRNQRILQVQDAITKSGQYILSPESFIGALKTDDWVDRFQQENGEENSQKKNFANETTHSIEDKRMTAIALLPMGTGYSTIVLSGQSATGAGVTSGRMFNNLKELQSWLAALNVRAEAIPQSDFEEPLIVEVGEVPLEPAPQPREKVVAVLERAAKQAKRNHSPVVFVVNDYRFKITAASDIEEEYSRYWDFIKRQ
jgi:hypothetical protein